MKQLNDLINANPAIGSKRDECWLQRGKVESKNGSADDEDEEDEDEDGEGEDEVDEDMDSEVSRTTGLVRAGHWQSCRGSIPFLQFRSSSDEGNSAST